MRKKEPPSPAMAAQEVGLPLSPAAFAEALDRKREALDREIAEFTKRKEEEFCAYERRLSVSGDCRASDKHTELSKSSDSHSAQDAAPNSHRHPSSGDRERDPSQPSPLTPQHDKERELHGLFLPHFIPLLDEPAAKRTVPSSSRLIPAEIPARLSGLNPIDLPTFSPRTSPSPTLIAAQPALVAPASCVGNIIAVSPRSKVRTDLLTSSAIPRHVRVPSWSSTSSRNSDPGSTVHTERPGLTTRSSSSQSEVSVTSLRSSLRKSSSATRAPKKKQVRLSIGNAIIVPSDSPVQTRSAFKLPMSVSTSYPPSSTITTDMLEDRGRVEERDDRAGKARIDDEGGARRRRKKRTSSTKPSMKVPRQEAEPLDYFPPQPLRSPGLKKASAAGSASNVPRYAGTELINPTTPTTPPTLQSEDQDEFDIDDPLFGVDSREQTHDSKWQDDFEDEENVDVVNGHDLVEDQDADEFDVAMPSPSPHASSMPIGIRAAGWRTGKV